MTLASDFGAGSLFSGAPSQTPSEISKAEFARRHGITPGRVSQMIRAGLPVSPSQRIPVAEGDAWVAANIRTKPRKTEDGGRLTEARTAREETRLALDRLELAENEGRLIDRKAAEAAIEERARAERDAHLAWVSRIVAPLAAKLGCDPAVLFAELDREMRDHLEFLAETSLQDLSNA